MASDVYVGQVGGKGANVYLRQLPRSARARPARRVVRRGNTRAQAARRRQLRQRQLAILQQRQRAEQQRRAQQLAILERRTSGSRSVRVITDFGEFRPDQGLRLPSVRDGVQITLGAGGV